MFKILETVEDGEKNFCVVPSAWEVDSRLHWPTFLKDADVMKIVRNASSVPSNNWSTMPCIVKAIVFSYSEAKQIENLLYAMCTETETAGERIQDQHVFAAKKRKIQTKFDSNEYYNNVAEKNNLSLESTDTAESVYVNAYSQNRTTPTELLNLWENNAVINENIKNLPEKIEESETVLVKQENLSTDAVCSSSNCFLPTENVQDNQQQRSEISYIKESMEEFNRSLSAIHNKLDELLKHADEENSGACLQTLELVLTKDTHFPLKTQSDISTLNVLLNNDAFQKEMIKRLSTLGGRSKMSDGNKVMYRIINYMFTPEILDTYSWTGASKSNEKKECFQKLNNIIEMIYNVIALADSRHTRQKNDEYLRDKILKHTRQRLKRKMKEC